ncbi:MAG: ArnT family glycosyltransferase [Rhodomicrobium sp.]
MLSMRRAYFLAVLFAVSVPVLLALLFLPTPHNDTREIFDWGQYFSLSTPKQPPMMQWLGAMTERLFAPTAFWALFVTQLLTLGGLAYLYATLCLLVERDRAALFTLLFATSISVVAEPLPSALNPDIVQFPFWAAIVYHALRAARTEGLLHWICLAVATAAAFYTKYTVVFLLAGLGIASLAVSEYRSIWRDRRLYLSAAIFVILALPHILAAPDSGAVGHVGLVLSGTDFLLRAQYLGEIPLGFFIYLAPAWIVVAVALMRGDLAVVRSSDPAARFVRITLLAAVALIGMVIAVSGHRYESRYDLPLLFLAVLAAATLIGPDGTRWAAAERWILQISAAVPAIVLVGGSLIYGVFFVHSLMQEPTAEAAAVIEADWAKLYTCGPAYVRGDPTSTHGIAIALKPPALGVPISLEDPANEYDAAHWYDPARLKRLGAVVVYPEQINRADVERIYPNAKIAGVRSFTLPYLRTLVHATKTYTYFFLPPEGCDAPGEHSQAAAAHG